MLGQPVSMLLPEVIGFKLTGKLKEGVTATDLVLMVVQMLRKKGVVSKFVEFFGPGLDNMTLADRATIGNMGPEYGATCGFFPVDGETVNYLTMSGREEQRIALVEAYSKAQGMWRDGDGADLVFTDTLELDLGDVVPAMAGPKRPEGRIPLENIASGFATSMDADYKKPGQLSNRYAVEGTDYDLGHGDVVDPPGRIEAVDADQHLALAEPAGRNRLGDLVARHSLGVRRHRILEVENDAVGGQIGRLFQRPRVRSRHEQQAAARTDHGLVSLRCF